MTYLFSLENKNLWDAAPQNTATGSAKRLVLKTWEEYFLVRSKMNFSGWPFLPVDKKWRVSPMNGRPIFPGGRFG